jgi:hypothetical protein
MKGFNVTDTEGKSEVFISDTLAACSEVFKDMIQNATDDQHPVANLISEDHYGTNTQVVLDESSPDFELLISWLFHDTFEVTEGPMNVALILMYIENVETLCMLSAKYDIQALRDDIDVPSLDLKSHRYRMR